MKDTADFLIKTIVGMGVGAGSSYVLTSFTLPFGGKLLSSLGILAGVSIFLKALGQYLGKKE